MTQGKSACVLHIFSEEIVRCIDKRERKGYKRDRKGFKRKTKNSIKKSRVTTIAFCQGRELECFS